MLHSDSGIVTWPQARAGILIAIVTCFLVSCATFSRMDLLPVKAINPLSSYQYQRNVIDVAFIEDNQILILAGDVKGPADNEPEIRNYAFERLENVEIPPEFLKASKFLGKSDNKLSHFTYYRDSKTWLARYESRISNIFRIKTYAFEELSVVFEYDFIFESVPGRQLLLFAPKHSNTIFAKSESDPIQIVATQRNLIVGDLAYSSKTRELFAINLFDNSLIRYAVGKTGLEKKDQFELDVRAQDILVDETNENILILDHSNNELEVIRAGSALESVAVYPMPDNSSVPHKEILESLQKFGSGAVTSYHFQTLGAMVAIAGGKLKIQDTKALGRIPFQLKEAVNVRRIAVSRDQRYLLLLSNQGELLLYDLSRLQ